MRRILKGRIVLINFLVLLFVFQNSNCNGTPGLKDSGVAVINYTDPYYLNSNTLFEVSIKAWNNTSITYYAWFTLRLATIETG